MDNNSKSGRYIWNDCGMTEMVSQLRKAMDAMNDLKEFAEWLCESNVSVDDKTKNTWLLIESLQVDEMGKIVDQIREGINHD